MDLPVDLREQRGQVGRDDVDDVLLLAPRRRSSCAGTRAGLALRLDRLRGGSRVAAAAAREEANLRLGVVDQLGSQVAADVAAAHVDRRRGAGVRGRHHGCDVARLQQEEAGARGTRTTRGDERDDRHARAQLGLRDLPHRVEEAAGRVDLQHERGVVGVARGVDLVDDPIRRDRVDVGVEHDEPYVRRLGRGSRRQGEAGDQRHGQHAQGAHLRSQRTPAGPWEGRGPQPRSRSGEGRAHALAAGRGGVPAVRTGGRGVRGCTHAVRRAPPDGARRRRPACAARAARAVQLRPRGRALGGAARRGRGGAHARRVWRVVSLDQIGGRRRRARQPRRACLDAG